MGMGLGLACCLLLPRLLAATPVVSPNEGTIGTVFTISGYNFGTKKGSVYIAQNPCKVISWARDSIQCQIKIGMDEGSYDLTVKVHPQQREGSMGRISRDRTPATPERIKLQKAFTIKAPTLDLPEYRPHFLTAGESATVKGAYFGDGDNLLKVELEDLQGVAKRCKILRSSMSSITFELPAGIPGMCHLRISNSVGSAMLSTWGTFAASPENPPHQLGESWGGSETKDNAAAVVFRNKLWIFFPEDDGEDNEIQYKTWDGEDFAGDYNIKTATGSIQKSYAQPTPVVVKDTLYLFYTGLSGYLDYVIYYPTVADSSKRWQGYYTVPNSKLGDTTSRYAAVYNSVANRVEVY